MPKITIVMNCFNGDNLVREAIESVYAQTFTDWEIVFWDNASTDRTAEIAQSFDGRLRYFRSHETVPLGQARALAIAEARGEWIGMLDHDDVLLPYGLSNHMDAVAKMPDAVLSYGAVQLMNASGTPFASQRSRNKSGNILPSELRRFDINLVGTLVRKSAITPMPPISDLCFAEEYALFLHAVAQGPASVSQEFMGIYRVWNSGISRTADRHELEILQVLDWLCERHPHIRTECAQELQIAIARARYHNAKFLFASGKLAEARKVMASIRHTSGRYFTLFLFSYIAPLWRLIHMQTLKLWLSSHFAK